MKHTPLDAPFGVTIDDLDLATVTARDADVLSQWLLEHQLLLFRRQPLTDSELETLSGRFGRLEIDANQNAHSPFTPHVTYMSNLQDETGRSIGGLGSGEVFWHSDQFFRRHPATLAALYAVEVPPTGGDTSWCSSVLGYTSLPPRLRERIVELRARYQPQAVHTIEKREVTHPLVLHHPTSDRKSLYLFERCLGVAGTRTSQSPRRTSILPRLSPWKSPMRACGAFSRPSTTVSLQVMSPDSIQDTICFRNVGYSSQ